MQPTPEELALDEITSPEQRKQLTKIVARNPDTNPTLLVKLSYSSDRDTREGVVSNPNTPTNILLKLGEEFPEQLLDNPVFSLLLLEDINLIEKIPIESLSSLLKQAKIPIIFLEWAAKNCNYEEVLRSVAQNSITSETILEKMVVQKNNIGIYIAQRPNISINLLEKLVKYGDLETHLYLARNAETPVAILEKLAEHQFIYLNLKIAVLVALAKNPITSESILEKLAKDTNTEVKKAVASRQDLSKNLVLLLARDYTVKVKGLLLKNRYLSPDLLEQLTEYRELSILCLVARHSNTSIDLLKQLSTNPALRSFVAQNRSATKEILEQLACARNEKVCFALLKNPNTPANILEQLANNSIYDLPLVFHRNTSKEIKTKILERLARDNRFSVRRYVALHPNTPTKILIDWAHKSNLLRLWAAKNPSTPTITLERLASASEVLDVRVAVAKNPSTPKSILDKLSQDTGFGVRKAVANNLNTSVETLEAIAKSIKTWGEIFLELARNPNTPAHILEKLAEEIAWYDNDNTWSYILIQNPNISNQLQKRLLIRLAGSYKYNFRLFVVHHPNTPLNILEKLTQDRDLRVRQIAFKKFKRFSPCLSQVLE